MTEKSSFVFTEEIIRDGSYVSDFYLDRDDLYELASKVDSLSFVDLIDIGPGTGFGTVDPAPNPPAEEHLQIVSECVGNTGITTLLLPHIAGEEEIDLLKRYSDIIDLVRIGVDADSVPSSESLLDLFAKVDIDTSLNLLKTYLISPSEVLDAARFAAAHGADVVYVVDSAGGMIPEEVEEYVACIQENVDISVGYHGHDNLGWALQNALRAIDAGAEYIDASLQGVGRSAGNLQTELLCAQFQEELPASDWHELVKLEESLKEIYPDESGVSVKDILYGRAKFHSSFESDVRKFADDQGVSFFKVLLFSAKNGLSTIEEVRSTYDRRSKLETRL